MRSSVKTDIFGQLNCHSFSQQSADVILSVASSNSAQKLLPFVCVKNHLQGHMTYAVTIGKVEERTFPVHRQSQCLYTCIHTYHTYIHACLTPGKTTTIHYVSTQSADSLKQINAIILHCLLTVMLITQSL